MNKHLPTKLTRLERKWTTKQPTYQINSAGKISTEIDTGWWKNLSFTLRLPSKTLVEKQMYRSFTILWLTLLLYLRLWFWTKKQKLKREEYWPLSKYERFSLQGLYNEGGAAFGSERSLVKTSNLPVVKVRQFSISKPYFTKTTPATSKLNRMETLLVSKSKFSVWTWHMLMNQPKNDNNDVKYLLVRQDLSEGSIDAKERKQKSPKNGSSFFLLQLQKNNVKKLGLIRQTKSAGDLWKLCKAEGKYFFLKLSETKAALPERTTWYLKINLPCYREET